MHMSQPNKNKEYSLDEILKNYYVASDLDKEKGFFMCSQTNHIMMNDEILGVCRTHALKTA